MSDAVIKRIMPHDAEAEQSVIGSMLMDKDGEAGVTGASSAVPFRTLVQPRVHPSKGLMILPFPT